MKTSSASASCCSESGVRTHTPWFADRRVLVPAAIGIVGAGLWFGWPTLTVLGIAPLLLALAPCLLMCGAMCAMKACSKPGKKAGTESAAADALTQHVPDATLAIAAPQQDNLAPVLAGSADNARTPA